MVGSGSFDNDRETGCRANLLRCAVSLFSGVRTIRLNMKGSVVAATRSGVGFLRWIGLRYVDGRGQIPLRVQVSR